MYIITGKLNGEYEIEGELKEVKTRFRFIANILVFYCKCFYDWVYVKEE